MILKCHSFLKTCELAKKENGQLLYIFIPSDILLELIFFAEELADKKCYISYEVS